MDWSYVMLVQAARWCAYVMHMSLLSMATSYVRGIYEDMLPLIGWVGVYTLEQELRQAQDAHLRHFVIVPWIPDYIRSPRLACVVASVLWSAVQ